jgi:hypothetical protein
VGGARPARPAAPNIPMPPRARVSLLCRIACQGAAVSAAAPKAGPAQC